MAVTATSAPRERIGRPPRPLAVDDSLETAARHRGGAGARKRPDLARIATALQDLAAKSSCFERFTRSSSPSSTIADGVGSQQGESLRSTRELPWLDSEDTPGRVRALFPERRSEDQIPIEEAKR